MYQLINDNPSIMYFQATRDLMDNGDKVSPRDKLVAELRPACLEFKNPYNRVTFLKGRRINPFFQIAESLWILSGRADVEFLTKFNANMKQFSDDGKWFNASYGERIRMWNKNTLHNVIINPIDQLADVYRKLLHDKDTRQAVIVISNPMFDNSKYTIDEHGRDIACNLVVTFKIRHDKLNMTVFNRSNDLHWGVFGANLCQFSTIQEALLGWLRASRYPDLKIGTYCQITDSLHIYLDDYGFKITDEVLSHYKDLNEVEIEELLSNFEFRNEPRMSMSMEQFDDFLHTFWNILNPYLMDDNFMGDDTQRIATFGGDKPGLLDNLHKKGMIDDYWHFAIQSMVVYRLVKIGKLVEALEYLGGMTNCQWKVSMLHFLKSFVVKKIHEDQVDGDTTATRVTNWYADNAKSLLRGMTFYPPALNMLEEYLRLE